MKKTQPLPKRHRWLNIQLQCYMVSLWWVQRSLSLVLESQGNPHPREREQHMVRPRSEREMVFSRKCNKPNHIFWKGYFFCVLLYLEAAKRQVLWIFQIDVESELFLNRFIILKNWSNLESLATFLCYRFKWKF